MRKRSGRPPRFAAVPNETIDDAVSLDFMALGLLAVLLRHRDGWEITLAEIGRKYGYGRDALANAMGLLMVARYVLKVRIQSVSGNQWSTEIYVFDTPATDTEVTALLTEITRDLEVREARLIPPTNSALEHAAKRRQKLEPRRRTGPSVPVPRVPENPHSGLTCENDSINEVTPECRVSRLSGDPALSKKTVGKKKKEKTSEAPAARSAGDARRASTGSSARGKSGAAASNGAKAPKKSTSGKGSGTRMSRAQAAGVKAVEAAMPAELVQLLPAYRPTVVRDTILTALESRSPAQLADRVRRRWYTHGYANAHAAGNLDSPVGVVIGLVRPSVDCPDPMCEDGITIDIGEACRTCEQRRADRRQNHKTASGQGPEPARAGPTTATTPSTECEGREGMCGRPVRPGHDRCTTCLELPWCACRVVRLEPGDEMCPDCAVAARALTDVFTPGVTS